MESKSYSKSRENGTEHDWLKSNLLSMALVLIVVALSTYRILFPKKEHNAVNESSESQTNTRQSHGWSWTTSPMYLHIMSQSEAESIAFQRNWPRLAESSYGALVLPPQCKWVEPLQHKGKALKKRKSVKIKSDKNESPRYDVIGAMRRALLKLMQFVVDCASRLLQALGKPFAFGHREIDDMNHQDTQTNLIQRHNSFLSQQDLDDEDDVKSEGHDTNGNRIDTHEIPTTPIDACNSHETDASSAADDVRLVKAMSESDDRNFHSTNFVQSCQGRLEADLAPISENSTRDTVTRTPLAARVLTSPSSQWNILSKALHPSVSPVKRPKHIRQSSDTMNFFEAPDSDAALKQLSREVILVPDKNGYVLCPPTNPDATPLLVFVNSRSGLQQGALLLSQLRRLLNPVQVFDLGDKSKFDGPEPVIESFCQAFPKLRVLVCGGDGTVSWITSAIERVNPERWPPLGILPLGTGNDLARYHGWGGGYNNEPLIPLLEQVSQASISMLDRWEMEILPYSKRKRSINAKAKMFGVRKIFTNYFSVGADAHAALQVHNLRENDPKLFFSRAFNKVWYFIAGGEEMLKASCAGLPQHIRLEADGVEIPLPTDSQCVAFLNIDSYLGGVPLWSRGLRKRAFVNHSMSEDDLALSSHRHKANPKLHHATTITDFQTVLNGQQPYSGDFEFNNIESMKQKLMRITECSLPSSCQDGFLDVLSVRGTFHLGQIRVGIGSSDQICQCKEVKITLNKPIAIQIDGEPWMQKPCVITIRRQPNPIKMLQRVVDVSGGIESEVSHLLEWAEENSVIDSKGHEILMKEFSKRVELRKRTQRHPYNPSSSSLRREILNNNSM